MVFVGHFQIFKKDFSLMREMEEVSSFVKIETFFSTLLVCIYCLLLFANVDTIRENK